MTCFHHFSVFAASRSEGLHPKVQALLERAAAAPFSEVSMRHDGLIQAGPSPDSEVVSSRVDVTLFSRERAPPRCCCAQTGNAQAIDGKSETRTYRLVM